MLHYRSHHPLVRSALRLALTIGFITPGILASTPPLPALACPNGNYTGNEAFNSTISLQMPFIAGEEWRVGSTGSFYGEGNHCNVVPGVAGGDYYATDWNWTGGDDNGKPVLPVASGTVSAVVDNDVDPCPGTEYGCYVQIDHSSGYRTLYAHLSEVLVGLNNSVATWTGADPQKLDSRVM